MGGVKFLALLERGNEHDVEVWSEQLVGRLQKHTTRSRTKRSASPARSVSPWSPTARRTSMQSLPMHSKRARRGSQRGGNQAVVSDRADADTRVQSYDKVWVKHIKAALMENRFRLVQQPVASLQGEDPAMFDVLVRMVDGSGKEVLPSEFMAAAERNDLMKNIDRWVVGASLSFAAQRKPGCLFVRLSKDTVAGCHLPGLAREPRALQPRRAAGCASRSPKVSPRPTSRRSKRWRACCGNAASALRSKASAPAVISRAARLRAARLRQDRRRPRSEPRRRSGAPKRVRDAGRGRHQAHIQTIAERVEDANTMAVLWQIGVQYIQGYFINEPEQVVLGAAGR